MGTSSIFNGNNDRNPLLPSDYDDNVQSSPVTWQTVKTDMTKYINGGGGNGGGAKHIVKQYVKASGGYRNVMSTSSAGFKTAGNLGNMFQSIYSTGIQTTLHNLGIQLQGKSVTEVFSRLVDVMSPGSNTKEETAARKAAQETLADLYDYVEENNMDLLSLDNIPLDLFDKSLCKYIGIYIWNMMMKDLGSRFEKNIQDPVKSYQMECEFKDIIMSVVEVEFKKKGSLICNDINNSIMELKTECLKVLEGVE